jgi:hypothetical protein
MIVDIIGDSGGASDEEVEQLLVLLIDEHGRPRPRVAWALGNLGRHGREHLAARFLQGLAVEHGLLRGATAQELSGIFSRLSPDALQRAEVRRLLSHVKQHEDRNWVTMAGLAFSSRWESEIIQAGLPVRIEIDVWNVASTPVGVLKDMPWAGSNWMDLRIMASDGVPIAKEHWDHPPPRLPREREFVTLLPGEQRNHSITFTTHRERPDAVVVSIDDRWPLFQLTVGRRYDARLIMSSRNSDDSVREPRPPRVWNGAIPLPVQPLEVR